jgi:PadR family transcriptional regulator
MKQKPGALEGPLGLMVLKTVDVLKPLHGYGIRQPAEQISGICLSGTKALPKPRR